jgi:hypothetical protein
VIHLDLHSSHNEDETEFRKFRICSETFVTTAPHSDSVVAGYFLEQIGNGDDGGMLIRTDFVTTDSVDRK